MRIIFIGAVAFSRRALAQLVAMDAQIVGVCTLQKSSFNADHCDLSGFCADNRIPHTYTPDINSEESLRWIANMRPDIVFCFGWSKLLQKKLLNLATLGVVGYHPTALPANRGRHPLIWALVLGMENTASTFFFMDEAPDGGDILSQERISIHSTDDAATLYEKVTNCALEQIRTFLPQLQCGRFPRVAQDARSANTWRKRTRADGQIDWRMSFRSIHNLVRGLGKPYVGAHFLYREKEIKVWETEPVLEVPSNVEPGKIIEVNAGGAVVKCGEHGIRLVKTEPRFEPAPGEYL
jgi:methionyl-tRNA formyltransferase